MPDAPSPDALTIAQVAALLHRSTSVVRRYVRDGELAATREEWRNDQGALRCRLMFDPASVEAFKKVRDARRRPCDPPPGEPTKKRGADPSPDEIAALAAELRDEPDFWLHRGKYDKETGSVRVEWETREYRTLMPDRREASHA